MSKDRSARCGRSLTVAAAALVEFAPLNGVQETREDGRLLFLHRSED